VSSVHHIWRPRWDHACHQQHSDWLCPFNCGSLKFLLVLIGSSFCSILLFLLSTL
jgi:hypothetical protein